MKKQPDQLEAKRGRKENLTKALAQRIVVLIQNFPDRGIDATWANVIKQVEREFGQNFHRNTLSQKEWEGQKLIANAVDEAKDISKRQQRDDAPKYANNSRARLRLVISKLQAENEALRNQLADVRAQQYDEFHSLLDVRTPLNVAVQERADRADKSKARH